MHNIKEFMQNVGACNDSTVLIHSAFKKLAANNLNPYQFIGEIVDYFDGIGTILMPSMSWKYCTLSNPYFDVRSTPGNVGILSEIFRKNYAKFRSIHPTHSVCGRGVLAQDLLSQHHTRDTPCSVSSPFKKLADIDGLILLIGVNLNMCTLFHCAEEMVAQDVYLNSEPQEFTCLDSEEKKIIVYVKRHKSIPRHYINLKPILEASGALKSGTYMGVEWTCIKAKASLLEALNILRRDPYYFYKMIQ